MNQHEITERRPLLDASGNLTEPGYAKTLLPIYRRSDIKAGKMRIKEWDYYCVNNGHFALALTIADNSYMGLDSISLLNLDEGWQITKSPMRAFTNGRIGLPESSETGDVHSAELQHPLQERGRPPRAHRADEKLRPGGVAVREGDALGHPARVHGHRHAL